MASVWDPNASVRLRQVEEFERARSMHQSDPKSIRIAFYFKQQPVPRDQIVPDQIAKVDEFRKSLGEKGIYWWEFDSPEEFETGACTSRETRPRMGSKSTSELRNDRGSSCGRSVGRAGGGSAIGERVRPREP